jgi:hypothetical protein
MIGIFNLLTFNVFSRAMVPSNRRIGILRKRIDSYYRLVVKNLRDLVPKNIKFTLLIEATKMI